MLPDPQRSWFVYFKEKEVGPIAESDVIARLEASELDATAYVFTEGMSDWALVGESPLFKLHIRAQPAQSGFSDEKNSNDQKNDDKNPKSQTEASAVVAPTRLGTHSGVKQISQVGQNPSIVRSPAPSAGGSGTHSGIKSAPLARESTANAPKKVSPPSEPQPAPQPSAAPPSTSQSPKASKFSAGLKGKQKLLVVSGAVLAAGLGLVFAYDSFKDTIVAQIMGPDDSGLDALPAKQDSENGDSTQAQASPPQSAPPSEPPTAEASQPAASPSNDLATASTVGSEKGPESWEDELQAFRSNTDPKSAPYRVSSRTVGGRLPVLVGAISPLLDARLGPEPQLLAAVYPDVQKSLYAIPKIWTFRIPVVSGYFSLGPLSDAGVPLLPGRYKLLVKGDGKSWGETSFELGQWPNDIQLQKKSEELLVVREKLAAEERDELSKNRAQLASIEKSLLEKTRQAQANAKNRREFLALTKRLKDSLQRLERTVSRRQGPFTFHPQQQDSMRRYIRSMTDLVHAYEILVTKGQKALRSLPVKSTDNARAILVGAKGAFEKQMSTVSKGEYQPIPIDARLVMEALKDFEEQR